MKPGARITLLAVALVMVSAGTLYPVRNTIQVAQADVDRLEADLARDASVHDHLMAAHEEMLAVKQRIGERNIFLCPDTPEAEHEFETALLGIVEGSGLHSVRTDRQPERLEGRTPTLVLDLVVEGEAQELETFLIELEGMRWVTRVLAVSVEPGNAVRRMTLQIAVILEQKR